MSSPRKGLTLGQDTWVVTEAAPTECALAEHLKSRCSEFSPH